MTLVLFPYWLLFPIAESCIAVSLLREGVSGEGRGAIEVVHVCRQDGRIAILYGADK